MPIPPEILAVARPKNTIVRKSGDRYLVVKRTCKRKDGRNIPVDLGTVGQIVNGAYVEKRKEPRPKTVDIKDYGEVKFCDIHTSGMLQELADVWDIEDAKRLLAIALLRAAYGDVRNRDLVMHYQTSFVSEMYPGLHLSENAVSDFLLEIGQSYSLVAEFMRNRVEKFACEQNIIIDGMLKDYNSDTGSLSEFSRKARKKGTADINILYAFSPESMEPIAAKPYAGNLLDKTAIRNFIHENSIANGMMYFDKGFYSEDMLEDVDKTEGLSYMIPLRQNSTLIARYGMDNPTSHLEGWEEFPVLYKKVKTKSGKFLYSFRNPKDAYEQEVGYVQGAVKKGKYDEEKYLEKKKRFGLITFKSKADVEPLKVYQGYAGRWDIEVFFNLYKNIIDRDTINVHGDYRTYATEFINFLTTIIAMRVKKTIVKKELNKKYSFKQIFKYLSKYKKARLDKDAKWKTSTMPKYIEEMIAILGI